MRVEDFSNQSPGRLAPVEFGEEYFESGASRIRQVQGLGFIPDPLPPKALTRDVVLRHLFDPLMEAERSLSLLEGATQQMRNPHLLIGPFLLREAKLSSAIEDTFASAQQLALFRFDQSAVEDRDQVREVANYITALEHGLQSNLPVCLRLIREMHRILLDKVRGENVRAGEFRTFQNAIGRSASFNDARFVPPPVSHLHDCLANLETYLHAPDDLPRLVRFALVHYQFEAIHPFGDGNGRLGRLLIVLLLCEQAQLSKPVLYVSGYFEKNRQRYYDLLYDVSVKGAWIEWVRFFLQAISTQAKDAYERMRRIEELNNHWQELVREKRASALLPQLVDQLFVTPSLTVAEVSRQTGVTARSATGVVQKLVAKGILVEATGRQKNRIYVAPDLLAIIES